jgi:hypothetical protein
VKKNPAGNKSFRREIFRAISVGELFSGTGTVFFHFAEDPFDLFLFHQNDFSGSDVVDRSRYFDLSGLDCGTDGSTVVKELPDFPEDIEFGCVFDESFSLESRAIFACLIHCRNYRLGQTFLHQNAPLRIRKHTHITKFSFHSCFSIPPACHTIGVDMHFPFTFMPRTFIQDNTFIFIFFQNDQFFQTFSCAIFFRAICNILHIVFYQTTDFLFGTIPVRVNMNDLIGDRTIFLPNLTKKSL